MTGRQETNQRYQKRILKHLKTAPQYVSDYYYTISEKTDSTKFSYITRIIQFLEYMKNYVDISDDPRCLSAIRSADVAKYLEHVRYNSYGEEKSASARSTHLFALKSFWDYIENEGYVTQNVISRIKPPKINQDKEIKVLNNEEISSLLTYVIDNGADRWKYRDAAIMCLGFTAGLRISAICEINIEDLDLLRGRLQVVEKRNKERTVYLGRNVVNLLTTWMEYRDELLDGFEDTNVVFFGKKRMRLDATSFNRILSKYTMDLFGVKYSPHKMRSSCATNLYEATGDLYLVQTQLGHSNPQTTMRYVKMSQKRMQRAATTMDALISF